MTEPAIPDLVSRLRKLTDTAAAAGVDSGWLSDTSDGLVACLLELASYRRGDLDPRRQRTIGKAQRVANIAASMESAGMSSRERMAALRSRFGISKASIHRLIALARQSHDFARLTVDTVE